MESFGLLIIHIASVKTKSFRHVLKYSNKFDFLISLNFQYTYVHTYFGARLLRYILSNNNFHKESYITKDRRGSWCDQSVEIYKKKRFNKKEEMKSKDSIEITALLTKLYTLQEDVGAKSKTTDAEKQQKASASISMGQGKAGKKTGSRFLELKSSIIQNLKHVHQLMQDEKDRTVGNTSVAQGNNPKEIIMAQNERREKIRSLSLEWDELNSIYITEANKRKSRFTKEELEVQSALVIKLRDEIDKVKTAQTKAFAMGSGGNQDVVASALNSRALSDLDATPLYSTGGGGGGGGWSSNTSGAGSVEMASLTDNQRVQLQQLQERDADFDNQLDVIGEGIETLGEIAAMQSEEVNRQNVMLDNLGKRIDTVHDHVTSVNVKLKDTLKEVGRSSDKICVDIMCIVSKYNLNIQNISILKLTKKNLITQVLMIGFAAVIYNIFKNV